MPVRGALAALMVCMLGLAACSGAKSESETYVDWLMTADIPSGFGPATVWSVCDPVDRDCSNPAAVSESQVAASLADRPFCTSVVDWAVAHRATAVYRHRADDVDDDPQANWHGQEPPAGSMTIHDSDEGVEVCVGALRDYRSRLKKAPGGLPFNVISFGGRSDVAKGAVVTATVRYAEDRGAYFAAELGSPGTSE